MRGTVARVSCISKVEKVQKVKIEFERSCKCPNFVYKEFLSLVTQFEASFNHIEKKCSYQLSLLSVVALIFINNWLYCFHKLPLHVCSFKSFGQICFLCYYCGNTQWIENLKQNTNCNRHPSMQLNMDSFTLKTQTAITWNAFYQNSVCGLFMMHFFLKKMAQCV